MRKKHKTQREKKQRCITAIGVTGLVIFYFVLAWQAVSGIIRGDWLGAENYYNQPIDPAIQLIVLAVGLVVGVVAAWEYLFKKGKKKAEKKKRNRHSEVRYPHEQLPW